MNELINRAQQLAGRAAQLKEHLDFEGKQARLRL